MNQENHESKFHTNPLNIIVGILVGGLAGSVMMLLLAPRSGKDTRMRIQAKGNGMRDWTNKIVEDSMAQVLSNGAHLQLSALPYQLDEKAENISNQVTSKPKTEMQKMSEEFLYNDSLGG